MIKDSPEWLKVLVVIAYSQRKQGVRTIEEKYAHSLKL